MRHAYLAGKDPFLGPHLKGACLTGASGSYFWGLPQWGIWPWLSNLSPKGTPAYDSRKAWRLPRSVGGLIFTTNSHDPLRLQGFGNGGQSHFPYIDLATYTHANPMNKAKAFVFPKSSQIRETQLLKICKTLSSYTVPFHKAKAEYKQITIKRNQQDGGSLPTDPFIKHMNRPIEPRPALPS